MTKVGNEGLEPNKVEWVIGKEGEQTANIPAMRATITYWPNHTAKPVIWFGDQIISELEPEKYIWGETEWQCKEKAEDWVWGKLKVILDKLEYEEGC